ncbi:MAG: hypothetical protein ACXWYS_02040 [Gaiellaceae bacterium]
MVVLIVAISVQVLHAQRSPGSAAAESAHASASESDVVNPAQASDAVAAALVIGATGSVGPDDHKAVRTYWGIWDDPYLASTPAAWFRLRAIETFATGRSIGRDVLRVVPLHTFDPQGISPDGRSIAFARKVGKRSQLVLASAAEPSTRRLLRSTSRQFTSPVFSPDGRWLATTQVHDDYCGDRRTALSVMRSDGARARTVALPSPDGGVSPWVFAEVVGVSPDAAYVAVLRRWTGDRCDKFYSSGGVLVDVANGSVGHLVHDRQDAYHADALTAAKWSHDGAYLAFTAPKGAFGGACDLYVAMADGTRRHRLRESERCPAFEWSMRNELLIAKAGALFAYDPETYRARRAFTPPPPLSASGLYPTGTRPDRVVVVASGHFAEQWFLVDPSTGASETLAQPDVPEHWSLLALRPS